MNCDDCGAPIAAERLRALPSTTTCVNCSREQPKRGFMSWEHKTAPTLILGDAADIEVLQRYDRRRAGPQLPLTQRENPLVLEGQPENMSFEVLRTQPYEGEAVNRTMATCHPDREAVGGKRCLECALAWYAARV